MADWLGTPVESPLEGVEVEWQAPNGTPGIMSVTFDTPHGAVTV